MSNKINPFDLCAAYVRDTSCRFCLHYDECKQKGKPVSARANFMLEVINEYLPKLTGVLAMYCTRKTSITWLLHDFTEADEDPLAVMFLSLRIANARGGYKFVRIPCYFDDDYALIETRVIRAYAKFMKGKQDK